MEQKLQTTKEMNTTDTIQIHALENIRDVLQSGMMETAENITNLILSRLIIDITHTLLQHMVK